MNFKTYDITVHDLLINKEYSIPSFQRNYSWEPVHVKEFIQDIIKNMRPDYKNKNIDIDTYFLGTMVFVDNFQSMNSIKKVIDGQQRLTTITMLLSVIAKKFKELKLVKKSEATRNFIVFSDVNGNDKKVLDTPSNFPYFTNLVQLNQSDAKPVTEEEENIKKTYEYYLNFLSEKQIFKELNKIYKHFNVKSITYEQWLTGIRDQILKSMVISINTDYEDQANTIFEILNAKGKKLSSVDLMKNKIFEIIGGTINNFAEEEWNKIVSKLTHKSRKEKIDTFVRHYWSMKYKKVTEKTLYDDFLKKYSIEKSDSNKVKKLLIDLKKNAEIYSKIMNPHLNDWNNRQELESFVQSMKSFEEIFRVVSARVVLMALINAREKKLISEKKMKDATLFLEDFYLVFFSFLSMRASQIEKIISDFSISLLRAKNKDEANKIIDEKLISKLSSNRSQFDMQLLKDKFLNLSYTKESVHSNLITKLLIRKFHLYYNESEVIPNTSSVEHILNENNNEPHSTNIGNLILLEKKLNDKAGSESVSEKIEIYKESSYKEVLLFVSEYDGWDESNIRERAEKLYELFITEVIHPKLSLQQN